MDYDKLKQTGEYELIYKCVENHYIMKLVIDDKKNIVIETEDVNELFEDVKMYYKLFDPYCDNHLMVRDAIIKIYKYIELEESIDHLFDNFHI